MRVLIPFVLSALVLAAGCRQDARPAPEPESASAAAPDPVAPPPASTPATAPAPVADAAMAPAAVSVVGVFAGGGTRLELGNDGAFALVEGDRRVEGTWTSEQEGRVLRLDPGSKSEPDRVYHLASADELRPQDGRGAPLRRQPAQP